jgi:3-carboxy-cis,cis-muconate cycloisomerase
MTFSALDSDLLGPLFATDAMRTVFSDRARLGAMLQVEAALAKAAATVGRAKAELAAVVAGLDVESFDLAALGRETALAGVPVIPFLEAVRGRLPPELAGALHEGATTQDIVDTSLVLQMRSALAIVTADLEVLLADLSALADTHRAAPCVGRTYGQHAAPITFGFKVAVWLAGLTETADRLNDLKKRSLVASLGGPVGTLAAFASKGPQVLEAFASELALGTTAISWHTNRGRMAEIGAWLGTLLGALAKIATDVVLLGSTDLGEVSEPHVPGRGGSSSMPHKRNPVSATVILAAHAAARGHVSTLLDAMAAAHQRPAGLWHAEWHALPPLFGLVSGALREARTLATGLVVHPGRMLANLDASPELASADRVPAIVSAALWIDRARAEAERVRSSLHAPASRID